MAITSLQVALPRTISSSRITLAGLKKCVPITHSGREVAEAISSMFERGGVGGEDSARLRHLVQLAEDLLLERHAFEDGFDDHVDFAEAVVGERGADASHPLVHLFLRKAAFLHRVRVVLANGSEAAVERCLIGFLEKYRDSRIRENHGDAAAHGAGANHSGLVDRNLYDVFRDAGNLRHFAVAEEDVDQSLGLVRKEAFLEKLGLALARLRRRAAWWRLLRRRWQPVAPSDCAPSCGRRRGRRRKWAHLFARCPACHSDRASGAVVFRSVRAKATAPGSRSPSTIRSTIPDSSASSAPIGSPAAHISTAFATPASRGKALRSRCSRNDPQLHFRLADLRAGRGHAVMTSHGSSRPPPNAVP